jgi:hypothetical protein
MGRADSSKKKCSRELRDKFKLDETITDKRITIAGVCERTNTVYVTLARMHTH